MRISPRISIGISVSVGVRSRACTRIGSRRPRPKYTLVDRHGKPGPGARRCFSEAKEGVEACRVSEAEMLQIRSAKCYIRLCEVMRCG